MPTEDRQLAEHPQNREYVFQPLPADALDRATEALSDQFKPDWPAWLPTWKFDTPEIEEGMDAAVNAILAEVGPAEWRVTTSGFHTFEEFHAERLPVGHPI